MRDRHFLPATALALVTALGFASLLQRSQASAQTASEQENACRSSTELFDVGSLSSNIYSDGEGQALKINFRRADWPEEPGSAVILDFQNPGKANARLGLWHVPAERLTNAHVRWTSGSRTHQLLVPVTGTVVPAPDFLVPDNAEDLAPGVRVEVYYAGSDHDGRPDEEFFFDDLSFIVAFEAAQEQMAQLRQRARAGRCDATLTRPGCFLTSAAVQLLGRADDCWELASLRRFRDGWLAARQGGAEQIAEYYRRAPAIAARLSDDPQRLARLYLTDILPSAVAARLGLNRLARALYVRMMRKIGDLG